MSEAMKQVKKELGDDAIIVNSREEDNGWVKITAAIEQDLVHPAPKEIIREKELKAFSPTPKTANKPKTNIAYNEDDIQEIITDAMLRHRVPARVSEKIISTAMTIPGTDPKQVFMDSLNKIFSFKKSPTVGKERKIMLVGAPGAGKTLMAAKLAAKFVLEGGKPVVLTTDTARAGGIEQLSAFLKILDIPLHTAKNAKELEDKMAEFSGHSQAIIDTGGLNPFDPNEMKFLSSLIKTSKFEPALVLPAGMDAEEAAEIAMAFSILGVKQIIPTRLDFSRYYGGILNAADRAGLYFSESSHNSEVANGILYLNSEIMADLLIPHLNKKG